MGKGTIKKAMGTAAIAVIVATGFGATADDAQAIAQNDPTFTSQRTPVTVAGCKGAQITIDTRERDLIDLHNAHRKQIGKPQLCVEPSLQKAAEAHARDMMNRKYFSHTSPEGTTPAVRAERAGYKGDGVGENISSWYAEEPASSVMQRWLNSAGHRSNIEDQRYAEIGMASADSAPVDDDANASTPARVDSSAHVAMFAQGSVTDEPVAPGPVPQPAPAPAAKPAPNVAPSVTNLKPAPGRSTRDKTPMAAAVVRDANSKLAASRIKVYVDGRRARVNSYNASTGAMKSQLPRLKTGKHTLKIVATDGSLQSTATSRFTVR